MYFHMDQSLRLRWSMKTERSVFRRIWRKKPSFPVRKYHIDTNEHVNNCQYVQMALEVLPEETRVRQIRVEYKKSAVLGDVIFPKVAREENRIVTELCDENGKPYAVIEIK